MKIHVLSAVLLCGLLSLTKANVAEIEQGSIKLEEEQLNVDKQVVVADEEPLVASPEVQKVLQQIPELVQAVATEQISDQRLEEVNNDTEELAVTKAIHLSNSREPKQLIGFIPTHVLRNAIHLAQLQQSTGVRSLKYYGESDDYSPDEVEEERAIRRRKRFRRRNSKGHLKKNRRHKNNNRRKLNKRRKYSANNQSYNRRKNLQMKNSKRQTNRKRKPNRRQGYQQ